VLGSFEDAQDDRYAGQCPSPKSIAVLSFVESPKRPLKSYIHHRHLFSQGSCPAYDICRQGLKRLKTHVFPEGSRGKSRHNRTLAPDLGAYILGSASCFPA
jgi:hypothetical protein